MISQHTLRHKTLPSRLQAKQFSSAQQWHDSIGLIASNPKLDVHSDIRNTYLNSQKYITPTSSSRKTSTAALHPFHRELCKVQRRSPEVKRWHHPVVLLQLHKRMFVTICKDRATLKQSILGCVASMKSRGESPDPCTFNNHQKNTMIQLDLLICYMTICTQHNV